MNFAILAPAVKTASPYFHPHITETIAIAGGVVGAFFFAWWIKSLFAKKTTTAPPAAK